MLAEGRACAVATVVETWGSSAVQAGGVMVVAGEDDFFGSVSGGCVEADVIAAAIDVIGGDEPKLLEFGVDDQTAWRAGLACGGRIRVHVARLDPLDDAAMLDAIASARANRQPRWIATRLSDGRRSLLEAKDVDVKSDAASLATAKSGVVAFNGEETFLQALTPPPRVVIVGATHIAQILHQTARAIGYDVAIWDPRGAFTSEKRFRAGAATTAWPEAGLQPLVDDPFAALVTLTHADNIDDEALMIALRSRCRYIGALGAKRTHQKRVARLSAAGFSEPEIARIHAPIGLDIGAKSAGEIAIAILADVIAAFRSETQR